MKIEDLIKSKTFKITIIIIISLIVALLIFKLGMFVGSRKALFNCRWAEHYAPNFFGHRPDFLGRFMENFDERNLMKSHGAFGKIIQINQEGKTLVVKNENEPEKIIVTNDQTFIEKGRQKIAFSDLKTEDFVVVIGEPNSEGKIEAKILRVLPQPPENFKPSGFWGGRQIF